MHLFTSHRRNTLRYFANFDLPLNPICWAFGHKARGVVKEWRFNIPPSLFIQCRWCDARYRNPDADIASLKDRSWTKEKAEAQEARRLEVFQRDPKMVERNASGRVGYAQNRLELSLELVDRRAALQKMGLRKLLLENLGFKFHVGDRSSETPFDGHVDLGVAAAYWSIGGIGGRLAESIGRGQKRNLSLRLHGGQVWWELWHDDEGGNADNVHKCDSWRQPTLWPWSLGRKKHRPWMCLRRGNLQLNPADALWGTPTPDRVKIGDEVTLPVPMGEFPGDTYLMEVQRERWDWRRVHGPIWARKRSTQFHADWRSEKGVPVSTDRDWKGNEVLASGVNLTEAEALGDGWQEVVIDKVVAHMKESRRRHGYKPPAVPSP